jgi:hypothetical protein
MKPLTAFFALACAFALPREACALEAKTLRGAPWSSSSVYPVPARRWEFGLFQSAHYGVNRRVELALHPLLTFVLPHLEVKVTALEAAAWALGVKARVSYPSGFLALVSREGTGGLLPKTTTPPFALQIEGDLGGTLTLAPRHRLTAWLGLAVAPHARFTPEELPLLDFPFLYPRFAPLYTPLVPRAALDAEGALPARFHYHVGVSAYLMPQLPDVGTAFAVEPLLSLEYRPNDHVGVSAGLRASYAEYPVGARFHPLPFADVRVGF